VEPAEATVFDASATMTGHFCASPLPERSITVASDIFAKIGDIKGESTDAKHKDEIDVLSWSWGVTHSGSVGHGGGGGAGKASFHDLNFTHHIDKATPLLMKSCATGTHIPEAVITVRKAGKSQQEYLVIKMNQVLITSVAMSVSVEEPTTAENVTLQAAKVDLEYRAQKADGSLEPGLHFRYDVKTNKVL
jgi:type VI secretion system secreted protein Hcp